MPTLLILRTINVSQHISRFNPSLSLIWTSCDAFMRAKKTKQTVPCTLRTKIRNVKRFVSRSIDFVSLSFFFPLETHKWGKRICFANSPLLMGIHANDRNWGFNTGLWNTPSGRRSVYSIKRIQKGKLKS